MRRWLILAGVATAFIVTAGALTANTLVSRITYAKVDAAEVQRMKLCQTLARYALDNGHLPSEDQGLQALIQPPSGRSLPVRYPSQGYVQPDDLVDPWGNPYRYEISIDGDATVLSTKPGVGTEPCMIGHPLADAD
jgi:general secretion pathway protein G